jgi:hypothetical protein
MYSVEFKARIKNGSIEIPRKYRRNLTKRVRVILVTEGEKNSADFIDQLLARPARVQGFQPLTREQVHAR